MRAGKVQRIPVKLGMEDKYYIEIKDADLKPDDQVIVQGKGLVNEGMEVIAKVKQ